MARLMPKKALNGLVANMAQVQAGLDKLSHEVAGRAEADLAKRHKPDTTGEGHHEIEVTKAHGKYGHVDREVAMVGPAPAALEYGHRHNFSGKFVRGAYILLRAAGLV